jgi:dipeptidyl aminopeptidase/acylaminoacyl peptidase
VPTRPPTDTPPPPTPVSLASLQGWILFWSDRTGQEAVFAVRPDGSELIPLAGRALYDLAAGQETREPGGDRWLLVLTEEGNSDIWRRGPGENLRLTSNPASDYDPAWSPDGRRMVFVSGRGGSDDLWLMEMSVQGEQQLTYYGGFDKHPSWSPDGRQIVFWSDRETGRKQIWIVGVDGSNLYNLSNSPYNDWDPVWVKYP